jgi:hypothetical protein
VEALGGDRGRIAGADASAADPARRAALPAARLQRIR